MDKKNIVYLSASRIKTFESCSWLYWCKYRLKLPDTTNAGAQKGSLCHLILELLLKPRHKKHFDAITKLSDMEASEAVKRLAIKHLKNYDIYDDDHYQDVRNMILVGLNYDFFGEKGTLESPEYEFRIENENPKYCVMGYIDKAISYKKDKKMLIADYKSGKKKFEGEELESNIQAMVYSLASRKIWPRLKPIVRFIHLKYGENPIQELEYSQDALKGFEYYLEAIYNQMEKFDEKTAKGNLASSKPFPKKDEGFKGPLQCGFAKYEGQMKKDGSPMWHCAYKFAFDYYAVEDKTGKVLYSSKDEDELKNKLKKGQKIVKKNYGGCPAHNSKSIDLI